MINLPESAHVRGCIVEGVVTFLSSWSGAEKYRTARPVRFVTRDPAGKRYFDAPDYGAA